jgi:hypothetical protein
LWMALNSAHLKFQKTQQNLMELMLNYVHFEQLETAVMY